MTKVMSKILPNEGAYGPCHACGGPVEEHRVDQPLTLQGRVVVVEQVPLGVCRRCGERVTLACTAKQIEALLHSKTNRHRRVAVYKFTGS